MPETVEYIFLWMKYALVREVLLKTAASVHCSALFISVGVGGLHVRPHNRLCSIHQLLNNITLRNAVILVNYILLFSKSNELLSDGFDLQVASLFQRVALEVVTTVGLRSCILGYNIL
jgi:hypothetical protein